MGRALGLIMTIHGGGARDPGLVVHEPPLECKPADLQAEKLVVKDVVVLIDREQGGPQHLKANGMNLHAAFTLSDVLQARICRRAGLAPI
jgi:hypothetical protein